MPLPLLPGGPSERVGAVVGGDEVCVQTVHCGCRCVCKCVWTCVDLPANLLNTDKNIYHQQGTNCTDKCKTRFNSLISFLVQCVCMAVVHSSGPKLGLQALLELNLCLCVG